MSSLIKKRKGLVWLLLVVTVFQTLISIFSASNDIKAYAAETANDKIQNSINLARGKSITDIDTTQITNEDLQVLGVFLSNFYEPWSTEVVNASDEDDIKKQQTDALVNTCNFDKDLADVLVQAVWEMSRQSATPLYIGKMKNDGSDIDTVHAQIGRENSSHPMYYGQCNDDPRCSTSDSGFLGTELFSSDIKFKDSNFFNIKGHTKATYFSFLDWFGGLDVNNSEKNAQLASFLRDKNYKFCLYWLNGDTKVPVFDTKVNGKSYSGINSGMEFTASSLMYMLINDELDYKNGVGGALSDCTFDAYNKLNAEQQKEAIILNSQLYVDCFGNILVDTGVSKYVLFPACANPYTWAKDKELTTVGQNINVVNLFALGEAESKNIRAVKKNGKLTYYFSIYSGDNSLLNQYYWRRERGSTETDLDENKSWFTGGNDLGSGQEIFNSVIDYCFEHSGWDGSNELCFPNWKNYTTQLGEESGNYTEIKDGKTNLITDFIQIDKLGAFKSNDKVAAYNSFQKFNGGIFVKDGSDYTPLTGANGKFSSNIEPGHLNTPSGASAKKYLTGIFCSYVLAYFNDGTKTDYPVSYYFAKNQFPAISDTEVDWSSIEISDETMNNEIKSMVYYFLHPTEGISYVANWFKNKVAGILVTWHEDMIGFSDTANSTGATKYLGFSGYVTLPTLTDISWTAWLLNEYNNIVVYLIIIIFIILITYCIVGSMTFQRAIIGTLLFGILAFFPPLCINASVNFLNNTCDEIYGDKFTYWAIVQHSSYLNELQTAIKSASDSGSSDNYLGFLFSQQEGVDATSYTRIKLKWLSPKKISTTADMSEGLSSVSGSYTLSNIMKGLVQSQTSGETFSDNENALYLYRDYCDLYLYSTSAYNAGDWYDDTRLKVDEKDLAEQASGVTNPLTYSGTNTTVWDVFSKKTDTSIEYTTPYWMSRGFLVNTGDSTYNLTNRDYENRSYSYLLDSMAYSQISKNNKTLINNNITSKTLDVTNNFSDSSFGLGIDNFNLTLADFRKGLNLGDAFRVNSDNTVLNTKTGDFYYALYTESPFYFFTWNILDQQTSTEFGSLLNSSSTNEKLLNMYTMNNQQYFYNYNENSGNGYGELRDFLNMHSLFYYVIPYLKACNEGVMEWSDLYGTFLYDDVKVNTNDATGITDIPNFTDVDAQGNPVYTDEYIYKWWHNYNVERLFNTYSAWVDILYSCDYAKSETISVSGKKYTVQDPLNPLSYCTVDSNGKITDGRMMVFSRSEMNYYGLSMKDLTVVEQKIINTQDAVYNDLLQLMDYYNLGSNINMNEVLTTASGMLTTFAFNKEFSQTSAFGTNYTLYPQSYELKAFSYDAYLRLILAESTGESLLDTSNNNSKNNGGTKSYYQRIVENSSLTTGIGFIILDVIVVYAIPALRLFFLIAIFFMSVLMIVAAAVKLEMNIVRTTWDSLVAPLLKFLAVSLGLAWVVSLFMTDGNTAVTGRGGLTISLGDPAMVTLVMIVINVVVLILYYKICKKCFKKLVEFTRAIGTSVGGAVAGTIGKVAGGLIGGKQISDSVARGTAKARGTANQPQATTSSGSGGFSSKAGSFASGALLGKTASDIANSSATSTKSDAKMNKYNEKSTKAEAKLNNLGKNVGAKKDEGKAEYLKKSHASDVETIKHERELLRKSSKNSTIIGKTSNFVKDKRLAVTSGYHKAVGGVEGGFYSARGAVKKGVGSATNSVRNSGVGKALKMDNTSRMKRYEANRDINLEKAIRVEARSNRKQFAKGKDKK